MISGHVIIERYINDPIISWYVVFSVCVSNIADTDGESGVRLIPGSMGVKVGFALSRPKWVSIWLMYDCWLREIIQF